jgi:alpha-beta hydrolase superfamily lysophospholipase
LIHGLGEHTGRYAWVAETLGKQGYSVTGFDFHGHGKSGGQRGHFATFDQALDDIQSAMDYIAHEEGKPVDFLYGHSMGGNLGINFLLRRKPTLKGAVITSPGLRTYAPTPAWKLTLGKLLYNLLPTFSMDNGLDVNYLSHDPQVKVLYQADPLTHKYISARFGLDFLQAGEWALQNANLLDVPMLIQAGSEDHLVSYQAAKDFADIAKGCDFIGWDGLYHETHNELEKVKVLDVMVRWLDQHV